jgi:capsular polysaccharide transport system permease protein
MTSEGPNPFYVVLRGAAGLCRGRPGRERTRLYEASRAALADELQGRHPELTARRKTVLHRQLSSAIRRLEEDIAGGVVDFGEPASAESGPSALTALGPEGRLGPLFAPAARLRKARPPRPRLLPMVLRRYRNVNVLARRFLRDAASTDPMSQLWAIAEPMFQIGLVVMIYLLLDRHLVMDMPAAPFAVLGVAAWLMFRLTLTRTGVGTGPYVGLMGLPRIASIDVFLARALVINVMYAAGATILLLGLGWLGLGSAPDDILGALGYWMLIWVSGLGIGLTTARVSRTLPMVRRMTPMVARLLFFVSGVVFVSEQLPEEMAAWLLWNPMLHALQLLRSCYFPEYTTVDGDPAVVVTFALICLAIGLMSLRAEQRRVAAL